MMTKWGVGCGAIIVLGLILFVCGLATGSTTDGLFISGLILLSIGLIGAWALWRRHVSRHSNDDSDDDSDDDPFRRLPQEEQLAINEIRDDVLNRIPVDETEGFSMGHVNFTRELSNGSYLFGDERVESRCIQIVTGVDETKHRQEVDLYVKNKDVIPTVTRHHQGTLQYQHGVYVYRVIDQFYDTLDNVLAKPGFAEKFSELHKGFLNRLKDQKLPYKRLRLSDIACFVKGNNIELKLLDYSFITGSRDNNTLLSSIEELEVSVDVKDALAQFYQSLNREKPTWNSL